VALRELVEQGTTILLTTHMMEEAEILSDRLAIIDKGSVIAEGTLEEVKHLTKDKFRVVIEGNGNDLNLEGNSRTKLGSKEIVYFADEDQALELVKTALEKGVRAEAARVTLEDVFVRLVGRGEEA